MSCQRLKAFIVQRRVTKLFSLPGQSSLVLALESGKCRLGIRRNFLPVGVREREKENLGTHLFGLSLRGEAFPAFPPPCPLHCLLSSALQSNGPSMGALHPVPAVLLSS